MVRTKEIWFILTVAVAVIIGGAFLVSYQATNKNRKASVGKLRAKAIQKPTNAALKPDASEESARPADISAQQTTEADHPTISDEESIAAFDRLSEKRSAILEDPAWQEAIDILDEKGSEPGRWTEEEKSKIAAYLAFNRDLILELHRLADLGGPAWDKELPLRQKVETTLSQLAKLRDYARLLAYDAMAYADVRNYEEALKSILAGLKLANTLDDALLVSYLVRGALSGTMCNAIETSIHGEDLPPDLCNQLLQCAALYNDRQSFANACIGEGNFGLMAFEGIRNDDLSWLGTEEAGEPSWGVRLLFQAYGSVFARPWLNMDEGTYADIMAQYADAAQLPFYQAQPVIDGIMKEIQNLPSSRVMSIMLTPAALHHAYKVQAASEVRLDLMRLGLAVEQYYAQSGAYPETLEQIATILGGNLPIDPFTGQPYAYSPGRDSFRLYCPMGTVVDMTDQTRFGADNRGNIEWRSR